jgi:hypothetical protein
LSVQDGVSVPVRWLRALLGGDTPFRLCLCELAKFCPYGRTKTQTRRGVRFRYEIFWNENDGAFSFQMAVSGGETRTYPRFRFVSGPIRPVIYENTNENISRVDQITFSFLFSFYHKGGPEGKRL